MRKHVVLGGGISGLSAAGALQSLGYNATILERNLMVGGLTRSMYVDGFAFDYTGHFLHLAKHARVKDLTGRNDDGWIRVARRAFCYVDGCTVEAPFQYNLGDLPLESRERCWEGFVSARSSRRPDAIYGHLEEYFRANFGDPITDLFLKPYNEKIFSTPLWNLSIDSISRFFPGPLLEKVRNGYEKRNRLSQDAYNSEFFYPASGGIQRLVDDLRPDACVEAFDLERIDLQAKRLYSKNNANIDFDTVFSSIPLPTLLSTVADLPAKIATIAKALSYNRVVCFQIGVSGKLGDPLSRAHWIYVPDPKIPFFRVGCYSNIVSSMAPPGCHAIYAEVSLEKDAVLDINALQGRVVTALDDLGWVKKEDLRLVIAHVLDPAYVHFDAHWRSSVDSSVSFLSSLGVKCIGRYGLWDYVSMEDVIIGARDSVANNCERRIA